MNSIIVFFDLILLKSNIKLYVILDNRNTHLLSPWLKFFFFQILFLWAIVYIYNLKILKNHFFKTKIYFCFKITTLLNYIFVMHCKNSFTIGKFNYYFY